MKTSDRGLALIKEFEGLRLNAYQDSVGKWTIGYGHTAGVREGDQCTEVVAAAWLASDVADAERIVNDNVWPKLNQAQFDGIVSFVYNVGPGRAGVKDGFIVLKNGKPSTLLKCLRDGDYHGAADQFQYWANAGGQKLAGLVRRRDAEKALFELQEPIPTAAVSITPLQEARALAARLAAILAEMKE